MKFLNLSDKEKSPAPEMGGKTVRSGIRMASDLSIAILEGGRQWNIL